MRKGDGRVTIKRGQTPSIHQQLKPDNGPLSINDRNAPKHKQQWCYRCGAAHDKHGPDGDG